MKRFKRREIQEAIQHAGEGGQALHVWEPTPAERIALRPPAVFKASKLWAHLFDQDAERLVQTARRLGVRAIKLERSGRPGQHIDLCGRPLERAMEECGPENLAEP